MVCHWLHRWWQIEKRPFFRRTLATNEPLPAMPLPLTTHAALDVNLEKTYMQAASDAYLT